MTCERVDTGRKGSRRGQSEKSEKENASKGEAYFFMKDTRGLWRIDLVTLQY